MTAVQAKPGAPIAPLEVRDRLVDALELDLVGPGPGDSLAGELLPGERFPSNWYLTGFLVPKDAPPESRGDDDQDEGDADVEERGSAETGENAEERGAGKRGFFPSSIGLSALVPSTAETLSVTVFWGDYERVQLPADEDRKARPAWRRTAREARVDVALGREGAHAPITVAGGDSLKLHVLERSVPGGDGEHELPAGTRSVSLFLVNERVPGEEGERDARYAFQVSLSVESVAPFVPRPDLRGAVAADLDERLADLHYADTPEYATGHGVSADWEVLDGECRVLCTRWLPVAEVERTETAKIADVVVSMVELGELAGPAAVHGALDPLATQYRAWLNDQAGEAAAQTGERRSTAEALVGAAGFAADRIARGIDLLAADPDALDAFRVANRAIAAALRRRLPDVGDPAWRPFQLAFILLNLPGVVDRREPEREIVDLLFFPTGGGKTEAYLGLAAFTIVLRRLRNPADEHRGGAGVAVVMRYTLRLLTLDQLARAAGLVCALELERERDEARYGTWPFEIGLWVGKAATPNLMGHKGDGNSDSARTKVRQFKGDPAHKPIPVPLEECPWCQTRFAADSFELEPDDDRPQRLRIGCTNIDCDFTGDRALPIVAVDEELYRRLPAFLIATVDKFASLPWVGPSGALLGGAPRHDGAGFYGAAEPGRGTRLAAPLLPPDLIIQDELHLISGPLGTVAGLYETAVEGLCLRKLEGRTVKPKIVASTATVRRAADQVQALFGRGQTEVFPPPGVNRRHSFFAEVVAVSSSSPGRQYVGVAAQGRNPKVVMRRVWLVLMAAAEKAYREGGGHKTPDNPADGYMTVLGYFNALRELGGARRILEEEIPNTLKSYGGRRRLGGDPGLFYDRSGLREPVELTSRVSTDKVAEARRRLGQTFDRVDRVDNAIATNMISVGLDIPRLGLMMVLGQPKTAAEYIQATSRVGRGDAPGLVVTVLNIHRPRDRSHYERYRHFHATFYRSVEVASVTPFSSRALDRGFAGALVALARHAEPALTPPRGAEAVASVRPALEHLLVERFVARLDEQQMGDDERAERAAAVRDRVAALLDDWTKLVRYYTKDAVQLQYQRFEGQSVPKPLLRGMLDKNHTPAEHASFRVNRSLRDVEPSVNLFLKEPKDGKPMPAKKVSA